MFRFPVSLGPSSTSLVSISKPCGVRERLMFPSVIVSRLLVSLTLILVSAGYAAAQDRRQNAPGEFDFYVLSLSWSPSFCEAASERGNSGRSQVQCERPFSFV